MSKSVFPTLLNRRAWIVANINRAELVVMAMAYLILSRVGIVGVSLLISELCLLVILKAVAMKTKMGFFINLRSPKSLNWKIGVRNE